ncbi:MAG: nucleotidyl transferase AbiEii/AbiGii toxin family protein [Deltaproteobacteria bacterium]|nr:nucleotidyl transferase AbiEii/AbiGii toxin family protein [Deltaproteobacteria bacterium]
MATLSLLNIAPLPTLSRLAVPFALHKALAHIFAFCPDGLWLVGGTALAGFYAKHRRSDDLDLFAQDEFAWQAALRAVRSLKEKGAVFSHERTSAGYFRTLAKIERHEFTIDIVLDENLFRVGQSKKSQENFVFADISTLLAMKVACLVSRASEKDLFDLDWILERIPKWNIEELIKLGKPFDAGLNTESLLISLKGSHLRKEACAFLLPKAKLTIDEAYTRIELLRQELIHRLLAYEKLLAPLQETKALATSLQQQKKFARKK